MQPLITRKTALWSLWVGFVIYAFGFAPPDQPDTIQLLQRLATAQVDGINPLVVALFNSMGVFPLIYAALLLFDGQRQRVPAAPFVVGSFAVGAFAVLPYLALREPNQQFEGTKSWLLKGLDSRWLGACVTIAAVLLLGYGITQGDWADFVAQWQTNRFIHVMSLDFGLLCLLFPLILKADMAHRDWEQSSVFWAVSLVPFLGAAVYLLIRPKIAAQPQTEPLIAV